MLTKQHESQPATDRALAQAKYVFSTGRLIHDRVFQIQARQIACMGKKKKFGDLSMAQVNTLMTIRKRGPMSLSELASDLCVSPPSASAMVDRLVEKGLVTREQSPEDRRRRSCSGSIRTCRPQDLRQAIRVTCHAQTALRKRCRFRSSVGKGTGVRRPAKWPRSIHSPIGQGTDPVAHR